MAERLSAGPPRRFSEPMDNLFDRQISKLVLAARGKLVAGNICKMLKFGGSSTLG